MLTHCVFFWAKPDLSDDDRAMFEQGLRGLLKIPLVLDGTVGTPASPNRPVVERSYSFALMLRFADVASHDAYQVHPIHQAFHARCKDYWNRVVAYDFS